MKAQEKSPICNLSICNLQYTDEFKDYLYSKGLGNSTVKGYLNDVLRFHTWLDKENVELETINYADVIHYLQGKKKSVKQRTVSINVNSLKHYFNFLSSVGILTENPTDNIEIKGIRRRKLYHLLSKQELESLYRDFEFRLDENQQNQNWYKRASKVHLRNKVILGLLIYQGLNTTDVGNLRIGDLRLREGKIKISSTRRSNERELTLEAVQIMDLMEYTLKVREELLNDFNKQSDYLIVSAGRGDKINNTMSKLFEKIRKHNSKIENVKQIRTSVITHWLKIHNLRQAQYMAGHRYVSSTESYLINDLDGLLEDITKFHPLG